MKKFQSLIIFLILIQFGSFSYAQPQQLIPKSSFMSNQWSDKANSMVKYQIEKRGIKNTDIQIIFFHNYPI